MGDHQPQNKKMRCSILFLSLAIIYASASPVDEVVPEESLYALDDDLSEARSTIEQMTTAGKSDKDCRKLVEETRKEVQTNVDTCTKTMDALPKGEACPAKGQAAVKAATEAKSKADKLVITTKTAVTKAESASVSFGSRTFSSLTEGKCESFYTSTSYTTAEATYKSAVTAHTKATGAAGEAAIALKNAVAAAAKEKAECECAVKKDHESKFSTLTKANAANEKAWNFACKVECVLDGKTTCKCSAAPKCVKPKATNAVMEAVCVAQKFFKIARTGKQTSTYPACANNNKADITDTKECWEAAIATGFVPASYANCCTSKDMPRNSQTCRKCLSHKDPKAPKVEATWYGWLKPLSCAVALYGGAQTDVRTYSDNLPFSNAKDFDYFLCKK